MVEYFADLHIHIGSARQGEPVKISAARSLTLQGVLDEALRRKGLDAVAIVDAASPGVLADIEAMADEGRLQAQSGGGLRYEGRLTLFLAAEIGVDAADREAHFLCYLPDVERARHFSQSLRSHVTNVRLSSQKARLTPSQLLRLTLSVDGLLIPAHIFTPHKGYYGNCNDRLSDVFTDDELQHLVAVELGLSADTAMAARLSELDGRALLSNSDAHSLPKIGREYNRIRAASMSFAALKDALRGVDGGVAANYGLRPALGKYHRTFCRSCETIVPLNAARSCPQCGSKALVVGVFDRLDEIADRPTPRLDGRPPYVHQIPLQFVPGVGPKTIERLLEAFGTEMNVLHRASIDDLVEVVGRGLANTIEAARRGQLRIVPGAGGIYGKPAAPSIITPR